MIISHTTNLRSELTYTTILVLLVFILVNLAHGEEASTKSEDVLVLTVATEDNEALQRYLRSAKVYSLNVKVLGLGEAWNGGDVRTSPGGGQKVNLVKRELEKMKDDTQTVVMFTDSYDVLLLGRAEKILSQFHMLNGRVVFGAESFCWPDEDVADSYPVVHRGKRFLNSGGYIGYASDLYSLLTHSSIGDADDDQRFFTQIYLNEDLRNKHKIKLDSKSTIFQNLNGATSEVELQVNEESPYVLNTAFNTRPLVLHGNGPTKTVLNSFGNYLANAANSKDGCVACWDGMISLSNRKVEEFPTVVLGIFIERPIPFMEEFFQKILRLEYPKDKITLFLHNAAPYHDEIVSDFISKHSGSYASVKTILPTDNTKEWHARNLAVSLCAQRACDYLFSVDGEAHIDNPYTLKLLIEQNRGVLAPILVRPYKAWSNFWGALNTEGFYARSHDYMDIVKGERRGLWNVPFMTGAYLVNGSLIRNESSRPSYINNLLDADMAFCANNRDRGIFMFISNRVDFGHLINADNFETVHLHNDLYQLFDNRWDWEVRYLHPKWAEGIDPNKTLLQPCPDVYWFPLVTERYCKEKVEEAEKFGKWSDGSNYDPRLDGGYENVPTVDIHMNQIGFEAHWLEILRLYVEPLQSRVYVGYHHYPPFASMNFIVRYKPDEQRELKPHHDTSTYTINIALNKVNEDFTGGGCRFTRYNCSVTDTKVGWLIMHPGKLTHQHEGLRVHTGTRYIMVSFIDP